MNNLKHTPGPWKIDEAYNPDYEFYIRNKNGDILFALDEIESKENDLKLIATSPKMLECLILNYKDILKINKHLEIRGLGHPFTQMQNETKDIIEKATGLPIEEVLKNEM